MMEIERKILGIDKRKLVAQIKKLRPAPKKLFEGLVRVFYFDFPDGTIRAKKDLLRLRTFIPTGHSATSSAKKSYTELVYKVYKGVKKGCKYFEELEVTTPGLKSAKDFQVFLKNLGLKQTLHYEKKRTLYSYKTWPHAPHAARAGAWKFEIDEHPKIPVFLEIEGTSPVHINAAIKLLKLKNHEQTADSIGELIRRKYPKISLNGLVF